MTSDEKLLLLGQTFTSAGPQTLIWQQGNEEPIWQAAGSSRPEISRLTAISPNGRLIATWFMSLRPGENATPLEIWRLATNRKQLDLPAAGEATISAAFSRDARWLVTFHTDNPLAQVGIASAQANNDALTKRASSETWSVRVWNAETGEKQLDFTGPRVIVHAFDSAGKKLAVQFRDGRIELWSLLKRERLFTWRPTDEPSSLRQLSHLDFTADGNQLAAALDNKGRLQLLDLEAVRRQLSPLRLAW